MRTQPSILGTFLIVIVSASWGGSAQAENPSSVYTSLKGPVCRVVSEDVETGDRTMSCPGAAGFSVIVQESDDRASLTIISPNKRTFTLNFWDVAIPGFSTIGRQLEWRQSVQREKRIPIGIIVQVDSVDQTDVEHPKPVSFFLVAHVSENTACLTAKIPTEQPDARRVARQVADDPNRRCLP